jgi:hypothetical protein
MHSSCWPALPELRLIHPSHATAATNPPRLCCLAPQLRFDDTFDDDEGQQQPQELPEYACA